MVSCGHSVTETVMSSVTEISPDGDGAGGRMLEGNLRVQLDVSGLLIFLKSHLWDEIGESPSHKKNNYWTCED